MIQNIRLLDAEMHVTVCDISEDIEMMVAAQDRCFYVSVLHYVVHDPTYGCNSSPNPM